MKTEQTFVMFKPDAMQRGLAGELMQRLERKGLVLVAAKMIKLDDAMLDKHYSQYLTKPFFPAIKEMMKQAPCLAMVWEGMEAISVVRTLLGATNGRAAAPGTIRGDYSISMGCNLVHASDGAETAKAEISRFFKPAELVAFQKDNLPYTYSPDERK